MRARYSCPCCGGDLGEAAAIELIKPKVTPQQAVLLDVLGGYVGQYVSVDEIEKRIYGDVVFRNGPSKQSISLQIHLVNKTLSKYGWVIISNRRGAYRLCPIEVGP